MPVRTGPLLLAVTVALADCGTRQAKLLLLPTEIRDSGIADTVDAGPDPDDAGPDAGPDAGDVGPDAGDAGLGCNLGASPSSIDFGKVIVGTSVSAAVTLFNDGGAVCHDVEAALGADVNPAFLLTDGQGPFEIAPGGYNGVTVTFAPGPAILPLFRTATLELSASDPGAPDSGVFLTASVSADCAAISKVIFTFDGHGNLASFDPSTLTFTDIGVFDCNDAGTPFSMSVDENGIAWVLYTDGSLYQVDTGTGACEATTYTPGQQGFQIFGMGDVFHSPPNDDSVAIAGGEVLGDKSQRLGAIDLATLLVTDIAPLDQVGWAVLSGTGDGELWGLVQGDYSPTGITTLGQIDPTTGNWAISYALPNLPKSGTFAVTFYGGGFWVFEHSQFWEVQRSDGRVILSSINDATAVVGAAVSNCATLQ